MVSAMAEPPFRRQNVGGVAGHQFPGWSGPRKNGALPAALRAS